MNKRMDKYKENNQEVIPSRSDMHKDLYKQVYNAYDEFENLVVPSNAREITPMDLKKEVTSRSEYRKKKEYNDIANMRNENDGEIARRERVQDNQRKENEIYDINELLNKAVVSKGGPQLIEPKLTNEDYLKKLKLDNTRTNIEQVKEMYDEIKNDDSYEDESLLKTANLSLEILTDLKGDNEKTLVSPPIKEEELPDNMRDDDFYSNTYKFSKKDFEDKKYEENTNLEDDDLVDVESDGNRKFFFKILLLILGISLVVIVIIYLFNYFNKV